MTSSLAYDLGSWETRAGIDMDTGSYANLRSIFAAKVCVITRIAGTRMFGC
jgi:hypothetical protein